MASTSSSSTKPTLLLFGVTGMTGKHVLAQAAASLPSDQWRVVAFVRSPSKLDAAGAAAVASGRVEVVQGDCADAAAVTAYITSVRPDAIVLTTNVGFSNDLTKSVNKGLLPVVTDALASSGRLEACRVIYLSGAASPNPPVPADYPYSFIQWAVQIKV
jgi:nucleoside-diphosphate-sugar epimerase